MEGVVEYEVRCPRCDVSFPTGTKRCIHCGGRTARSGSRGLEGPATRAERALARAAAARETELHPEGGRSAQPISFEPDEEELQDRRPGLVRSAVTLLWVLLAVAFSIIRACSQE